MLWCNLLCRDIEAQLRFYERLLAPAWREAVHSRSPIYRALECNGVQFGFNAIAAYELLSLADRAPCSPRAAPVTAYATFMLRAPGDVTATAAQAACLGGRVVKEPYATYYGQWQAALEDPEGHVFRVSAVGLPAALP